MNDDRKNIDRAFEIFGVYFSNCLWNRLYKTAIDLVKNGDFFDITESYKVVIERYNRGFGRQEHIDERINPQYTTVISDLKSYYEEQINKLRVIEEKPINVHLSDRDFIDTMSKYMLPNDEYEKLGKYDARKEKYFRLIMTQSVAKFTMFAIRSGVPDVVDKQIRSDMELSKRYIRNWCDQFISIITSERDQLCNLILASRSGIDVSKENMESVPKLVVDKLQEEMQTLINEKTQLEITINKYVDYVHALKKLVGKEEKKRIKLEKLLGKFTNVAVASTTSSSRASASMTSAPARASASVLEPRSALALTPIPTHIEPSKKTKQHVVGNSIVKDIGDDDEKQRKIQKSLKKLEEEEFSGEDFIKPIKDDKYLEEAGESDGSSYDSDEVIESVDDSLGSGEELQADE